MVLPLPELPEQGQTPWYDEREGFDLAVKDELENRLSNSGLTEFFTTLRNNRREPLNLLDFGAVGNGIADDTAAVQAWWTAVRAQGSANPRPGYAPGGTYKITSPIVGSLVNRNVYGSSSRATVFKAGAAIPRILDARESGACNFQDMTFDGNNLAQKCFDVSTVIGGSSSRISVLRVRILNSLDQGYCADNIGDSIFEDCNAGPVPDSSTIMRWSNQGGNSYLKNVTWFNKPAATGEVTGGGRASFEGSFQNIMIQGGGMMGFECLDGEVSQTAVFDSAQLYPYADGCNISGPKTSSALRGLYLSGSKVATHTGNQSYFGGRISNAIIIDNGMLNSGAESGSPKAFANDFVAPVVGAPMALIVRGSLVTAEIGAIPVNWNHGVANISRTYTGFQIGATKWDYTDVLDVGDSNTGRGLVIGGGPRIRQFNSTATAGVSFPAIASGSFASVNITMTGAAVGNNVSAVSGTVLDNGVFLTAEVTATNTVRVTMWNFKGSATTAISPTIRIYLWKV